MNESKSVRRRTWLLAAIVAMLASGCATVIAVDRGMKGDGWELKVSQFRIKSHRLEVGPRVLHAKAGYQFASLDIELKNNASKARRFLLGDIVVRSGDGGARAKWAKTFGGLVNTQPILAPGESISRVLFYVLPQSPPPRSIQVDGVGEIDISDLKAKGTIRLPM